MTAKDDVNHPEHYTVYPYECWEIARTYWFTPALQNVWKYIYRAPFKGSQKKDLRKAIWYLDREVEAIDDECSVSYAQMAGAMAVAGQNRSYGMLKEMSRSMYNENYHSPEMAKAAHHLFKYVECCDLDVENTKVFLSICREALEESAGGKE